MSIYFVNTYWFNVILSNLSKGIEKARSDRQHSLLPHACLINNGNGTAMN